MSGGKRSALGAIMAQVQQRVALEKLTADARTQLRERINPEVLAEYSERMTRAPSGDVVDESGKPWPPLIVYYDDEAHIYLLADGHHRAEAARRAELVEFQAEIRHGDVRDAILHAASANARHGLQPTRADKRRAVIALLSDPEWSQQWSDREIARRTGASHPTVGAIRAELEAAQQIEAAPIRRTASGVDMDIRGIQQAVPPKVRSKAGAPAAPPMLIKEEAGELSALPLERAASGATFGQLRALAGGAARVVWADWQTRDELFQLSHHIYAALGDGGALVMRAPGGELLGWMVLQLHDQVKDGRLLGPMIVVTEERAPLLVWTRGEVEVPAQTASIETLCDRLRGGDGRLVRIVSG